MRVPRSFMDGPLFDDDDALAGDVVAHLQECLPEVPKAYPPGYFVALVKHSALLARDHFGPNEVAAVRLFVRLRWEIAPGYYRHPRDRAETGRPVAATHGPVRGGEKGRTGILARREIRRVQ